MEQRQYLEIENTSRYEFKTIVFDTSSYNPDISHFHKNFEIISVISGTCHCSINGVSYTAKKGDYVFIFPFQIHSFNLEENTTVRIIDFQGRIIPLCIANMKNKISEEPVFRPSETVNTFFVSQMQDIFGDDSSHIRIAQPHIRAMLKSCLYAVGSEFLLKAEFIPASKRTDIVSEVLIYIQENFRTDISLIDVAKKYGYSYQYLSTLLNESLGITFRQLLNQYRIDYAFDYLYDRDIPITEIAYKSGFQSIRAFNYTFIKYFGKSPREIRQEYTNNVL